MSTSTMDWEKFQQRKSDAGMLYEDFERDSGGAVTSDQVRQLASRASPRIQTRVKAQLAALLDCGPEDLSLKGDVSNPFLPPDGVRILDVLHQDLGKRYSPMASQVRELAGNDSGYQRICEQVSSMAKLVRDVESDADLERATIDLSALADGLYPFLNREPSPGFNSAWESTGKIGPHAPTPGNSSTSGLRVLAYSVHLLSTLVSHEAAVACATLNPKRKSTTFLACRNPSVGIERISVDWSNATFRRGFAVPSDAESKSRHERLYFGVTTFAVAVCHSIISNANDCLGAGKVLSPRSLDGIYAFLRQNDKALHLERYCGPGNPNLSWFMHCFQRYQALARNSGFLPDGPSNALGFGPPRQT